MPGPPRGFRGTGSKLQNEVSGVCDRGKQKNRKQGNLRKLNFKALLEHCRLLLLGGSLDISKEAKNKNFDIS